jgi:hypothetical protein
LLSFAMHRSVTVETAEEAKEAVQDGQGVRRAAWDVEVDGDVRGHPVPEASAPAEGPPLNAQAPTAITIRGVGTAA